MPTSQPEPGSGTGTSVPVIVRSSRNTSPDVSAKLLPTGFEAPPPAAWVAEKSRKTSSVSPGERPQSTSGSRGGAGVPPESTSG